MKPQSWKNLILAATAAAAFLVAPRVASAQYDAKPAPPPAKVMESQTKDTTGGGLITFEAKLVDPTGKAAKKTATVEVKVEAISLIDPDATNGKPAPGQAHLHYQLDGGPVIATTATKLSFHGLSPGPHKIMVTLAGNDHVPIGRENVLTVTIP